MTNAEFAQCERFKKIRTAFNIKQGDFAKELAISQGHASDIENGRKTVSDRVMEIISLKYNINIEWLKTGVGEMFNKMDSTDIAFNHFGYIMGNATAQKKAVLSALVEMVYSVPDDKWDYIFDQFENCLREARENKNSGED